jgi:hypothetical protein
MRRADMAFRALGFEVPAEAKRLSRMVGAWADYLAEYETVGRADTSDRAERLELAELRQELGRMLDGEVAGTPPERAGGPDGLEASAIPATTNRLAVGPTPHSHPPHRLTWLPRSPMANAEPTQLYCWLSTSPERLATEGLAVAHPYLIAHGDPTHVAHPGHSGFVLRLDAPPGTAIVVSEYLPDLPAPVARRAWVNPDAYLIPVMWLSRLRLSAWYDVDKAGTVGAEHRPERPQLRVSFRGADHGVDGLPEGAVRWPRRRKHATAHLTLPEDPEWINSRLQTYPGWLPLQLHRVSPGSGYRILDVEVPRGAALDVHETLAEFADVPIAQSSLAPFAGVELVLPASQFGFTAISNVRDPGTYDRRANEHPLIGRSVLEAIPARWRLSRQEVGEVTDVSGPKTRHS